MENQRKDSLGRRIPSRRKNSSGQFVSKEFDGEILPLRDLSAGERHCFRCQTVKDQSEFNRNSAARGGFCSMCRSCLKVYRADQYSKHREKELSYASRRREEDPEWFRQRERKRTLKRYNLTPESYQAMLDGQAGKCAVCQGPPKAGESFHVDHDHSCCPEHKKSCGKCVRALLCSRCNLLLGILEEEAHLLVAVNSYLSKHKQRAALCARGSE